ncbi:rRNA maturation RNase YbeY [Roseinatronobacter alkalisoli]|uniref:Endoribonuclease YbeY n=1 Tax=Roseinatronobacter alkalisoli TaxID=3028235 RepID=A0ABT5T724_9RHOB|nr:rRNA maturation RNase YbeY [Roseinatronobacter sp. HJB301]MDD7970022.1 rRNA maturation RNase YbeY [Roseinatronobacter sp. HJB301]
MADTAPLVDLVIEDARWNTVPLQELAERAACAVLAGLNIAPAGYEIVLMACDDARIAELNAQFRGKPVPTNVLSWPVWDLSAETDGGRPDDAPDGDPDDPESLGDIALSYDTCAREAQEQGKTFDDHLTHLVVHSTLHLLGYDHIRDKDAAVMEEIEIRILALLGVADPYADGAEMPL